MRPNANRRLRRTIHTAGLTYRDLADELNVNHKTVQRWIYEGRTPRLKRALTIAARFGVEPLWLWPTLARDRLPDGTGLEATALIYSRASAMPPAFLRHLAAAAERELWILTGSQWFLECLKPHEVLWADRQASAVTRRLLVSPSLSQQLSPFAVGAISVRTSRDVGSSSMVRADDAMVVVSVDRPGAAF